MKVGLAGRRKVETWGQGNEFAGDWCPSEGKKECIELSLVPPPFCLV